MRGKGRENVRERGKGGYARMYLDSNGRILFRLFLCKETDGQAHCCTYIINREKNQNQNQGEFHPPTHPSNPFLSSFQVSNSIETETLFISLIHA